LQNRVLRQTPIEDIALFAPEASAHTEKNIRTRMPADQKTGSSRLDRDVQLQGRLGGGAAHVRLLLMRLRI